MGCRGESGNRLANGYRAGARPKTIVGETSKHVDSTASPLAYFRVGDGKHGRILGQVGTGMSEHPTNRGTSRLAEHREGDIYRAGRCSTPSRAIGKPLRYRCASMSHGKAGRFGQRLLHVHEFIGVRKQNMTVHVKEDGYEEGCAHVAAQRRLALAKTPYHRLGTYRLLRVVESC